ITLADVDGDGKIDIIAGNYGWNSKLSPSPENPVKLYLADLDKNGTADPLLTFSIDQKEYTFLGKGDIEKEVPIIKKKFLYYHDFAGKTVSELFGDSLKYSNTLTANSFTSGVFYNKGKGNFEFKAFPSGAQAAPLFGFAALPGTGKGILAGGNFSGVLPYEGRYDADYGDVILLDKNKGFKCLSPVSGGFLLRGEVRDIKAIKTTNGLIYAVAFNNGAMKFFKLSK
ncbi:MAG: FG-GAP repeat domain-containing protein, partial [Mucilaginibacter sp.]